MKLQDFIVDGIAPERKDTKDATYELVKEKPIITNNDKAPKKFEKQVLGYLFENKDKLGILEVFQLKNMLVDAVVRLNDDDRRLILLEFKYALNCNTSARARFEVEGFMAEKLKPELSNPARALVIFDHFSSDWNRQEKKHKNLNGWTLFYEEETTLRKLRLIPPIDIAQLTDKGLENPLC